MTVTLTSGTDIATERKAFWRRQFVTNGNGRQRRVSNDTSPPFARERSTVLLPSSTIEMRYMSMCGELRMPQLENRSVPFFPLASWPGGFLHGSDGIVSQILPIHRCMNRFYDIWNNFMTSVPSRLSFVNFHCLLWPKWRQAFLLNVLGNAGACDVGRYVDFNNCKMFCHKLFLLIRNFPCCIHF